MNLSEVSVQQGIRRGDWALMAGMNRNLVVNVLRTQPAMSRADIVRATNLSGPTVSAIIADLLSRGLVEDVGQGLSSGGRRPSLVRLKHEANYVVGLKLMGHAISLVVTDLRAAVVYSQVTPLAANALEGAHHGTEVAVEAICQAVEVAVTASNVERSRIVGVGIALAGAVDATEGVCHYSNVFDWHDVALAAPISARLGLPVVLENDANALTAAEQWFGSGHGVDHFLVIIVGLGIGAGVVVNGQLHRGAGGAAGEFGHIRVGEGGPPCNCGRHGCVEAWASDRAVLRDVREAIASRTRTSLAHHPGPGPLTIADVAAAADEGDALSREVLARSGEYLGRGAAAIINIIDPRLVVVSGEGVPAGEWRFGPMREVIAAETFSTRMPELVLHSEPVDSARWARGAACVVLGEIFNAPTKHSLVEVI